MLPVASEGFDKGSMRALFAVVAIFFLAAVGLQAAPAGPGSKGPAPDPKTAAFEKRLARLRLEQQELQIRNSIEDEKLKSRLAQLRAEAQLLQAQNARDAEVQRQKAAQADQERSQIALEMQRISLKNTKLNFEKADLQARLSEMQLRIADRKSQEVWRSLVKAPPRYTRHPFAGGRLVISDRRVELNGPIYYEMADRIAKQIAFYNNRSTRYPIFLVIEASPGGSVMAGQQILGAMQASKAPVIVVVKTYAASMAAVITALAPRSYASPNAILLHHQVSTFIRGNLTQQKERLRLASEWMRRLATPVAAKMGLSLDRFVKTMYQKNSDGDWQEFADQAVKLKWVDGIAKEIVEEGVRERPEALPVRAGLLLEQRDEKGVRFVQLPRLEPFDVHFIHSPDGYYRP